MSKEYISPAEYRRRNPKLNLSEATIKKMIRTGELKGYIDNDNGASYAHYHILVTENEEEGGYTNEYVESLKEEIGKYKALLSSINSISSI